MTSISYGQQPEIKTKKSRILRFHAILPINATVPCKGQILKAKMSTKVKGRNMAQLSRVLQMLFLGNMFWKKIAASTTLI